MLIYGPGQFFRRHQDTEKIPNMVATLVMVLPSSYKGGDLIIEHRNSKHKFFSSLNQEIIKCISFYSDCFHEVKAVEEGYRVALTYNVELKCGPITNLTVHDKLKNAVNNYFEESNCKKLVYFLDHEYTENSLRWHTLKGSDRICAKALMAVGVQEGHPPCLALADYHETYPELEDSGESVTAYLEKDTELYFWVDENNICFDSEKVDHQICFMKDTKEQFVPYKTKTEGYLGNECLTTDDWYHRSVVVLWRDTWAFPNGFRKEMFDLHRLTTEADNQKTLLKKINDNSKRFFSSQFWNDENIKKIWP